MKFHPEQIFALGKNQLAELVSLEGLCFSEPWSIEEYKKVLSQDNFKILGISRDNSLRAYISFYFTQDEAEIMNLAVHPAWRKKGLAKGLVAKTLEFCGRAMVRNIFLEVRPSNVPALNIYRHFGFKKVARRKKYYPDNLEDALVMKLELLQENFRTSA